jgi:hypothetical protein
MDSNKTITEILNIIVDCILVSEDEEQNARLHRLLDKFNMLRRKESRN